MIRKPGNLKQARSGAVGLAPDSVVNLISTLMKQTHNNAVEKDALPRASHCEP